MNAKTLGSGALMLVGVGGFLAYEHWQERRERKKIEEERAAAAKAEAAEEERTMPKEATWATMPDLRKKSEDEVRAILVEAGFQDIDIEHFPSNAVCDYGEIVDDPSDMVPQNTICTHQPGAGARVRSEKLRLRILVERDTFEHGGVATSEWRRMPNVLAMSVDEAKKVLAAKGFGPDEFVVLDRGDLCPPKQVCETDPDAGVRKLKSVQGTLHANLK